MLTRGQVSAGWQLVFEIPGYTPLSTRIRTHNRENPTLIHCSATAPFFFGWLSLVFFVSYIVIQTEFVIKQTKRPSALLHAFRVWYPLGVRALTHRRGGDGIHLFIHYTFFLFSFVCRVSRSSVVRVGRTRVRVGGVPLSCRFERATGELMPT